MSRKQPIIVTCNSCPRGNIAMRGTARFRIMAAGLLFGLATAAFGKAPDWLASYLLPEAKAWHERAPAVRLLDQVEVRFLHPDRVAVHVVGAVRANTISGYPRLGAALPYNSDCMRIVSAQAWIVSPEGKVTSVSRGEFGDVIATPDTRMWDNHRVLTYNASQRAEIGSVLAWEFSFEAPSDFLDVMWGVDSSLPLYHGQFEVTPAQACTLAWHRRSPRIPDPAPGRSPGGLFWCVDRLPALGGDRPAGFIPEQIAVYVRCLPPDAASGYSAENWGRLSRAFSELVEPRAAVMPDVKAVAVELTTGKTTRWERIRALTDFVQKKIIYLELTLDKDSLAGCRPHPASDVLRDRLGDCKDKATLLVAMLRAVGEDGEVVLVHANAPLAIDPEWPTNNFDHAIVGIPVDAAAPDWWPIAQFGALGRLVLFDPTNPSVPLGCLPLGDQGGHVLAIAPANGDLAVAPGDSAGYAGLKRVTTAEVAPDGRAKIRCEERYQGTMAAVQEQGRQLLGTEKFTQEIERGLNRNQAEIRDLKWSADWDPLAARGTLTMTFRTEHLGHRVGREQMLLTPMFPPIGDELPPWKTRFEGVSRTPFTNLEDEFRLTVPEGGSVLELPAAFHMVLGGTHADLEFAQEGDVVVCRRRFVQPAALLEKADYEALRVLIDKFGQAERRPVILKMPVNAGPAVFQQ
jgi:Transglutaminase-like superfamily